MIVVEPSSKLAQYSHSNLHSTGLLIKYNSLDFEMLNKFFSFISDYRYKKDEIFKRMKVTTFVQLVR